MNKATVCVEVIYYAPILNSAKPNVLSKKFIPIKFSVEFYSIWYFLFQNKKTAFFPSFCTT